MTDLGRRVLGIPVAKKPKKAHGPTFRVKFSSLTFETLNTRICTGCRGRVDKSVGDSHMCPDKGYWWGPLSWRAKL